MVSRYLPTLAIVLLIACGSEPVALTPELGRTPVLPTITLAPTPAPDVRATVVAEVTATALAQPPATPDVRATVVAEITATALAQPPATVVPIPTSTPTLGIVPAFTPPPMDLPSDAWKVFEGSDPMTDERYVSFMTEAIEHNSVPPHDAPILIVSCNEGVIPTFPVSIYWDQQMAAEDGSGGVFDGLIRFDSEQAMVMPWVESPDSEFTLLADARPFIERALDGESVYVRIWDIRERNYDALFDLTGLDERYASQPDLCGGAVILLTYDTDEDGRISCPEAQRHGIAPVRSDHPAYEFMTDDDGDGIVCNP